MKNMRFVMVITRWRISITTQVVVLLAGLAGLAGQLAALGFSSSYFNVQLLFLPRMNKSLIKQKQKYIPMYR